MKPWQRGALVGMLGVLTYRLLSEVDGEALSWVAGAIVAVLAYLILGLGGRILIWSEDPMPFDNLAWFANLFHPLQTRLAQLVRIGIALYIAAASRQLASNAFFDAETVRSVAVFAALAIVLPGLYWAMIQHRDFSARQ